jgi:hypothetical protein
MRHSEIRPEIPQLRLMIKMRDGRQIPMAHQYLSEIVDTVCCVDCDGSLSTGICGCLVVYPVAEVIEAVQLVEDFDLHDRGVGGTVGGVCCKGLRGLAEEVVVLGRGDGVDSHWVLGVKYGEGDGVTGAMLTS